MAIIKLDGGYNALPISYKRGNPIPLDTTAVWYDEAKLIEYATSGVTAYVGQVLTLVDTTANTATAYVIANEAGDLEPIGTVPVGDEKSIVVAEDGTISLKGVAGLDFNKKGEDGENVLDENDQPIKVQYQPLMTEAGLTWVIPSETTVEGLATLISGLTDKVNTLEGKVGAEATETTEATGLYKAVADEVVRATDAESALDAKIGAASVPESVEGAGDGKDATGVYVAIETEVARAKAAEKVLGERIDAIDFIDGNELAKELEPYAKTKDVNDALALKADITYVDDEIDKIEEAISNLNHFTAKVVTDKAQMTETGVLYLFKIDSASGSDVYEEYIVVDGVATLIGDTTTDLSNYYNKTEVDGLIDTVEEAIADEVEAREALAEKVTALEEVDNATQAELDAYKEEVTGAIATAKSEAGTIAKGYADTAKAEAIADADGKLANKANVSDVYSKSQTYSQAEVNALIDQVTGGDTSETAASVKLQLDNYKKIVNAEVWGNEEATGDSRIDKLEAVGAQANVIEAVVAAEGAKITATKEGKTVTINDSALIALINAAQAKGEEGVTAAGNAQKTADEAKSAASTNATAISELGNTVSSHTTSINDHSGRITTLENFKTSHETAYETLNGIVSGHTSAIATKAEQTALDAAVADIAKNTTDITTLNETTIPGINTEIGKKANSADVYTKTEIDAITGTPTVGKTLVDMIADAQTAATYDDTQVKEDIRANTIAITILNSDATVAGSVAKIADDRIAAALAGADADFDTLKEMSDWLSEHSDSAATMNSDIAALKAVVNGIGGEGQEATIISYVTKAIADAAPGTATTDVAGLVKSVATTVENGVSVAEDGTMSVNSVNVNKLVQDENSYLILNGGSANA